MSVTLAPKTALLLLVTSLLAVTAGSVVVAEYASSEERPDPKTTTVDLDDGTALWPYHSQSRTFESRTLPINMVIYGDAAAIQRVLREGGIGEWEEIPEDEQDIAPSEVSSTTRQTAWGRTGGAERYVYIEPAGEDTSRWTDANYHFHDGDYLGSRHHIRAYVDPSGGDWVALQGHREHWDWFRLRHTVHGVADTQTYVESQFISRMYVTELHRDYFGNDLGSGHDGWVTVLELEEWVTLSLVSLFVGLLALPKRQFRSLPEYSETIARSVLLAGAVAGPYLFVRFSAIGLEGVFPGLDPKVIVALLYPVLAVGVPVSAYLAARPLEEIPAFAIASIAFLVAIFLDYTLLGVRTLVLDTFLYHIAVAAAVGFIAAGASRRARSTETVRGHVRTGVLMWIVVGVLPLLRFVYPII